MSDSNVTASSSTDDTAKTRSNARALLETMFVFYRRLVSKKHGFTVWLEIDPASLSDAELEQAVAFVKDAAHLPPG